MQKDPASSPPQAARADTAFRGLRWGLALAAFEAGVAAARNLADLQGLHLRLLEFLLPAAVYGAGGALLGLLAGALPLPSRLRRLPVPLAASLAALGTLWRLRLDLDPGDPQFGPTVLGLAAGALAAAFFLWARPWRAPRPRRVLAVATGCAFALGSILTLAWLAVPRDVDLPRPAAAAPTGSAQGPNLVLITWDTVRADVLPIYGGTGLETPNLDALARRSVVFEDMTAVAPITGPTHASILTGLVPPSHGLRAHGSTRISPAVPTLAGILQRVGYATAAVVSGFPVKARFGFARGFDHYDDRLPFDRAESLLRLGFPEYSFLTGLAALRKLAEPALDGPVVLRRATDLLAELPQPFFLWTHFFDAHGPYTPQEPWASTAVSLADRASPPPADPDAGERMTGYRAEIMELDHYLGELLRHLEARDPGLEQTAIFLVADHGHCFGEQGIFDEHTPSLYEATQHIPAVLHLPGDRAGGTRVAATVNQVDILPTLCALAGLAVPATVQGVDLLPLVLEGKEPGRRWFSEGFYMEAMQDYLRGRQSLNPEAAPKGRRIMQGHERIHVHVPDRDERKKGLRTSDWSYVFHLHGKEELFDLHGDPETDVAADHPRILAELRQRLAELERALPLADAQRQEVDRLDRSTLEALGYAGGGGGQ